MEALGEAWLFAALIEDRERMSAGKFWAEQHSPVVDEPASPGSSGGCNFAVMREFIRGVHF